MNNLSLLAKRLLLGTTLLAASLPAQEPDESPPAEVVVITRGLDGLAADVDALQGRLLAALEQAKAARSPEEADALYAEVVQVSKQLAELNAKAADVRAAVHPLKGRLEAALKLPTADESKVALQKLERSATEAARGGDDVAIRLLGVVRFQLAEVMRQQAAKDMGQGRNPGLPSDAWNQVAKAFEGVLQCADGEAAEIGNSLHAAALAKVVECKVTLYVAYAAITPPTVASKGAIQRYEREARSAFERLQRGYPDKAQGGERRPLDVARDLIKRIR